jgi:hypothetical protein
MATANSNQISLIPTGTTANSNQISLTPQALQIPSQQAVISLKAYLGALPPNQQLSIFYLSPDTLTGTLQNSQTIPISGSAVDDPINLATLFPQAINPVIVQIVEVTTVPTGFSFTTVAGGGRQTIGGNGLPRGFVAWMPTALNTIYISNPSITAIGITIGVISN